MSSSEKKVTRVLATSAIKKYRRYSNKPDANLLKKPLGETSLPTPAEALRQRSEIGDPSKTTTPSLAPSKPLVPLLSRSPIRPTVAQRLRERALSSSPVKFGPAGHRGETDFCLFLSASKRGTKPSPPRREKVSTFQKQTRSQLS